MRWKIKKKKKKGKRGKIEGIKKKRRKKGKFNDCEYCTNLCCGNNISSSHHKLSGPTSNGTLYHATPPGRYILSTNLYGHNQHWRSIVHALHVPACNFRSWPIERTFLFALHALQSSLWRKPPRLLPSLRFLPGVQWISIIKLTKRKRKKKKYDKSFNYNFVLRVPNIWSIILYIF